MKKPSYEESYPIITAIIEKKRKSWTLKAIPSVDFDDVKSIIENHIFEKWHQYDPSRPLEAWVARITNNQFINILRNYYTNYTKPCFRCPAAFDENGCKIYGEQSSVCNLFAKWKRIKSHACNIKLPVSMENHINEITSRQDTSVDFDSSILKLNIRLEKSLKPIEWKIYKLLYIENLSEEEAANKMGYKTKEKNRINGYKRIRQLKNEIIKKAKEILRDGLE